MTEPTPEMLNDPDGRQLVAAIHARRAGKTTASKEAHLMFITTRAEAVRKWMATDLDEPRNLHGLERALDAQVGDVTYLIAELRKRDEAIAQAWDEGFTSGKSRAMRHMSDEPNLPLTAPNPYRKANS